jgi:polyphosphate kinase
VDRDPRGGKGPNGSSGLRRGPDAESVNDTVAPMGAPQPVLERDGLLANAWQDRDMGWLAFNQRVLHEAIDERTPLLERLKFLGIATSNLDEFFMKRVSMLRARATDREDPLSNPGDVGPRLARIRAAVIDMLDQQARCYADVLLPALRHHGIVIAGWDQLTPAQRDEAGRYFDTNVSAALTPLGLDSAHPFPFMSNLSTNWAFVIRPDESPETSMVRVKIPSELPAWFALKTDVPREGRVFLSMEELIRHQAPKLIPGMTIVSATLFRILRNADMALDEDDSDDLRDRIADALRERRFNPVVRVDFARGADVVVRRALMERFALSEEDVFEVSGLLDYPDLFQIAGLDVPDLKDPPWLPQLPIRLNPPDGDIFAAIDAGDILLHHPYESFDASVERFIAEAADDPRTLAIKMTVYRIGDDTPFVRALIRAAEAGKQVACVIEIKARFDEARNLHWARELENAGAHVTYGVMNLKTHTKIALVVQKRGPNLRCYAHIATGNYHAKTARLYADVGLLTSNPVITADVVNLIHYLTGHSKGPRLEKLLVAPINMRERFLQMIERETANKRSGFPARIIAKLNQIDDLEISNALASASQSGVPIDLIVRGFCCLRGGIAGWTENLRVRSIVGRFLEHSRIFYFANGRDDPVDGEFYIGSADWMFRNLSRRVEAATPIEEPTLRAQLWEILQACLEDSRQAWEMQPDGAYVQRTPPQGTTGIAALGLHAWLSQRTMQRAG